MDKTPVLIYTDIGRDVDDLEAMAYIAGSPHLEPVAVVTSNMIPQRRGQIAKAVMNSFGYQDVPIGVGSTFPIGNDDISLLEKYLSEHTISSKSYEGVGMLGVYDAQPTESAEKVILDTLDKYGDRLTIAVLAPPTDIAKAVQKERSKFRKVNGIYVMGQAKNENGRLVPDESAYNLKEDMDASNVLFSLQDDVPFTFITKFAAYQTPLNRTDFERFAETGHPVGEYLKTHAEKGLECFVRRAPEIFKRVFAVPEEQDAYEAFTQLDKLSNPYDALTVMAIARPELFLPEYQGEHKTIGVSKEQTGLKSDTEVRSDLVKTMLNALHR